MDNPNLPEFQCKPKLRMEKPVAMQMPNNHPPAAMIPCQFKELTPDDIRDDCYDLVFDPITPIDVEGPKFSGDFECGNIGQVYRIGERKYEIHLLPDPNEQQTTQWFFFKVENLQPGEYFFAIVGFYRACNLHWKGSQCCSYSEASARRGIGWQRIGDEMNYFRWKTGKFPEWAWTFKFTVTEPDNMYFSHAYPYTYTDMMNCLGKLQPLCRPFTLCKSLGDIDVPCVFWDAEEQRCVDVSPILADKASVTHSPPEIRKEEISEFPQKLVDILKKWRNTDLPNGVQSDKKPVIVICARTHPGETNSSFAMEGLLQTLFDKKNEFGAELRKNFSWLLIPMINPDGVICGFYRPSLSGDDMNRVWQKPDPIMHPIADNILCLLEIMQRTRPLLFFLDFHGHTAACNSFVYGFMNENNNDLYSAERVFPLLMTKQTPLFSNEMCSFLKQPQYEGTMRVSIRRRFHILFAYTLEMSYGGSDFGPRHDTQFTPHDYRSVGDATARVLGEMFFNDTTIASDEAMKLIPPPDEQEKREMPEIDTSIEIEGEALESIPEFMKFDMKDISITKPESVKLVLKQQVHDPNY